MAHLFFHARSTAEYKRHDVVIFFAFAFQTRSIAFREDKSIKTLHANAFVSICGADAELVVSHTPPLVVK